jgi:type IV pilus assembly protein PilA
MLTHWRTERAALAGRRGFTLVELMIVVAIIGVLAAIALPLYSNIGSRARIGKAQADLRTLASAVSIFGFHMGTLPAALTDLSQQTTNALGQVAGPFMPSVPSVPPGGSPAWTGYTYTSNANGTFSITAAGDGMTLTVP